MRALIAAGISVASIFIASADAEEKVSPRPIVILQKVVEGMPKGDKQEIRMLIGVIEPGQKTPFHTHPYPVGVYVLEGTFTLEVEAQAPVIIKAGEATVEPPNSKMTGYNRGSGTMKALILYVSDPDAPFLKMLSD